MQIRKLFNLIVSIMMLVVLLLRSATIFVTMAGDNNIIGFTKHNIADDFFTAYAVYAIDVDGDGDVDVLGAAWNAKEISWWENDGSENFTKHTIADNFWSASSVYATDVDGDGDVDVLGAAANDDDITWWENDGSENFTGHTIDGNFNGAYSVYAIDVDSDGDVDVLGAAISADDITWWENDGDENFSKHTIDGYFGGARSVYATDVDGDGDMDVLGAAMSHDDITWWENNGSENFTEHTIDGDFDGVYSVYATDVDGDGDVDVLGAAHWADDISWWENDGDENFSKHTISDSFGAASSVYATDVDGDEDVDVLGAAYTADDISWWENDGSENFVGHTIATNFDGAYSVYATDIDGDGDVDVLGAAQSASTVAWWEQGVVLGMVFLPIVYKNAGPPSSPPVLYEIINPGGYYNYTVSWSVVGGATSYELQEDDSGAFSSPTTVYAGTATSTSIYVGDVETYYYRVRALNEFGSTDWSNVQSTVVTVQWIGPEPGHYTGEPDLSFDVTDDQRVCSFDITIPFFGTQRCRIHPPECAEISSDGFTFSRAEIGAIFVITGTFDTPTHALGGYRASMCEDLLIFPASEGAWEASKQSLRPGGWSDYVLPGQSSAGPVDLQ